MKFLADECCDAGSVTLLRDAGNDVTFAHELHPGLSDDDVLNKAYDEGRILITEDKDFRELVYRLGKPARGIILLRIPVEQRHRKAERLIQVVDRIGSRLMNAFVVVELDKIRIRPLLELFRASRVCARRG